MNKEVFIPSESELLEQFHEVVRMVQRHNQSDEPLVEWQYDSVAQLVINVVLCAPRGHIAHLLGELGEEEFAKGFGMVCESLLHSEYCAPMTQKIASSLGITKKVAFFKFHQMGTTSLRSEEYYWGRFLSDLVRSGIGMDIVFFDAAYDEVGTFDVVGPAK